ncbi:MAG: hypothetical protein EKK49_04760, partial [Rhodocyclaceae bacterium]
MKAGKAGRHDKAAVAEKGGKAGKGKGKAERNDRRHHGKAAREERTPQVAAPLSPDAKAAAKAAAL